MNKIVALAGWGQPYDALASVVPEAVQVAYGGMGSLDDALVEIAREAHDASTLIGWSLGGQLAVRALARRMIAPERLVLIAAPFQFVETDALPLGMDRAAFGQFRDQYQAHPRRALKKFSALVAHGDARREEVAALLGQADHANDWSFWLNELGDFSAETLDFSGFPPTMLLHGLHDAVVHADQSRAYAKRIPHATLELWPHAAHAPHLHDVARFKTWIAEFAA